MDSSRDERALRTSIDQLRSEENALREERQDLEARLRKIMWKKYLQKLEVVEARVKGKDR